MNEIDHVEVDSHITAQSQSSKYFKLIQMVGSNGKYQKMSLVIWCVLWLITGSILLGTPFFMLNQPYQCEGKNITIVNGTNENLMEEQCQQFVCMLPEIQRKQFINHELITISNGFYDLHCGKEWIGDLLSSLVYVGCFFGYISVSIVTDNLGRKKGMLISYGICMLGMILNGFASNLYLIGVGLFLMGFGSDSAINICFYFVTETVESQARQKYSVFIQLFFCLGGVVNVGYFYVFKNWRIILWLFMIIPSILCLIAIIWMVKQTPYFMIKLMKCQNIIVELNKIHKLNHGVNISEQKQKQLIEYIKTIQLHNAKNVQSAKQVNLNQSNRDSRQIPIAKSNKNNKIYTPVDLFRYPSIRFISIAICILSVSIYLLYYGPLMLISKLSFNLYINALVVTASELVTYPFIYLFIQKIPRKKIGYIFYTICGITSFILIFVVGQLCQKEGTRLGSCNLLDVAELVLIFVFRFCSSFQFTVFLIYCNETLPTQVRGIGLGIASALGTMASMSSPYIFGSNIKNNADTSKIMMVFVVISMIGVGLWCKLNQTLGCQLKDQIQQVLQKNQEQRKREKHIELVQIKEGD